MVQAAKIGIIGGGISGLATAYYLLQESLQQNLEIEVTILERSDHLGGVIWTEKTEGFLLEGGPQNFVAFKPQTLELITELGLGDEVIGSNDQLRQTFVLQDSKLQPLPQGMEFLSPVRIRAFWSSSLISTAGKLRAFLEPFVRPSVGDMSVDSFLTRRLGRELTDKVAEPLVSAIYGGDIRELSTISALPRVYQIEQQFGSLWKGMRKTSRQRSAPSQPSFLALRPGMSCLIDQLTERLSEISIHRNVAGIQVQWDSSCYRVKCARFEDAFDSLILSTPASAAAGILEPVSGEAAHLLMQVPYASTVIVYLAYKRKEFSHPLDGHGFVVPRKEATVMDACTWVSSKFEGRCPPDTVLLRCSIQDGRQKRVEISDQEAVQKVHQELQRVLGITCQPILTRVLHARKALPQFTLGHGQRMEQIREALKGHPGLFLTGAYFGGVGIPDCIETAGRTARQATDFLKST
jgi:oxygen-dependent protoporphyrinogen oxidase